MRCISSIRVKINSRQLYCTSNIRIVSGRDYARSILILVRDHFFQFLTNEIELLGVAVWQKSDFKNHISKVCEKQRANKQHCYIKG